MKKKERGKLGCDICCEGSTREWWEKDKGEPSLTGLSVAFELRPKNKMLPKWLGSKESTCQCMRRKRCRFDPGLGRSPGGGNGKPTPLFLPGEVCHAKCPSQSIDCLGPAWAGGWNLAPTRLRRLARGDEAGLLWRLLGTVRGKVGTHHSRPSRPRWNMQNS